MHDEHMLKQYKRNPNAECLICKKEIYRRPIELARSKGRAYCSSQCYGKASIKEKPCLVCGKGIRAGLNKKTCSRICANRHRKGIHYNAGRPKDNVASIRAIKLRLLGERGAFCERCRYSKIEILQIHHKNRNKNDNRSENLEIICPNCHYEEHFLEKSWLRVKH